NLFNGEPALVALPLRIAGSRLVITNTLKPLEITPHAAAVPAVVASKSGNTIPVTVVRIKHNHRVGAGGSADRRTSWVIQPAPFGDVEVLLFPVGKGCATVDPIGPAELVVGPGIAPW